MTRRSGVTVAALLGVTGAVGGVRGQSAEIVYQTGQLVSGVGAITSPFRNGRTGFYAAAVNDSGQVWAHVGMVGQEAFDEAILFSGTGFSPLVVEGNDGFPLEAPSEDHVMDGVAALGMNNAGVGAFAFSTRIVDFPFDPLAMPTSGVYLGKSVMLLEEGEATGFDAGAVWAPFVGTGPGAATVRVNDANQWLIGHAVVEGGEVSRVIVRVQSDALGANLGETLIAREGGAVAGGLPGETWDEISVAPHAVAMNNGGSVIFTGRTSAGREGVFLNGAFVALTGAASPAPGRTWGGLLGASVDVNGAGQWVVRGVTASDGTWTEGGGTGGDAGEDATSSFDGDREVTGGGGALTMISGTLSDDHDVDVYRIRITDPANFSATTVGGPAAFDSVLWLIQTGHNFNGIDRSGLGRNDDVATGPGAGTGLSALGAVNAPGVGDYYLCVSTGKARAVSTDPDDFARGVEVAQDIWQRDPSSLALGAGGRLFWADPSAGLIRSVVAAGAVGAEGAALDVADAPTVPELAGAEIVSPVAFYADAGAPGGGWVYFLADSDTEADGDGLRRVSADGTAIQDIVPGGSTFWGSALAVDAGRGKVYWARRRFGQVWRANLDGSSPEMLIGAAGSGALLQLAQTDVVTAVALAVDETTGDVYAADPHREAIVKMTFPSGGTPTVVDFVSSVPGGGGCGCEYDGAAGVNVFDLLAYLNLWFSQDAGAEIDGTAGVNVFDLLAFLDCWFPASAGAPCGGGGTEGVAAAGVAIDQGARVIYFTQAGGRVLKAALTGGSAGEAAEVIGAGAAGEGAHAIAVDGAAGKVYWTDIDGREVWRANLDGSGSGVYFDVGPETGDVTADGDFAKRSPFSAWAKRGDAAGGALPYEIRLTGAGYSLEAGLIAKSGVKVAAFGDILNVPAIVDPNTNPPTTAPTPTLITFVGRTGQAVRIGDNGNVVWLGEWGGFGFDEGLFVNQTVVLDSVATPAELGGFVITSLEGAVLDASDSGEWAVIRATDGRFTAGNQALIRVGLE